VQCAKNVLEHLPCVSLVRQHASQWQELMHALAGPGPSPGPAEDSRGVGGAAGGARRQGAPRIGPALFVHVLHHSSSNLGRGSKLWWSDCRQSMAVEVLKRKPA